MDHMDHEEDYMDDEDDEENLLGPEGEDMAIRRIRRRGSRHLPRRHLLHSRPRNKR